MNIRLLQAEDAVLWKKFRLESFEHFPLAFASSWEEEEKVSDYQLQEWLKRNTIYGAFMNGQLVGSVGFFKQECLKESHRGLLFGMGVLPEYQRRGIGSELMSILLRHAQNEVLQLTLSVENTNQKALRLYQRYGFTIYGTEPRSLKMGDCFYDKYLMVLAFDATL